MNSITNNKLAFGVLALVVTVAVGFSFLKASDGFGADPKGDVTVGASSGPALINGCVDFGGGSQLCNYQQALGVGSTTCAFRVTASSTILRASITVANPKGGTFMADIGKSPFPNATTTILGTQSPLSTAFTLTASTSYLGGLNVAENLSPRDFVNFKLGTTTHNVIGSCSLLYMTI